MSLLYEKKILYTTLAVVAFVLLMFLFQGIIRRVFVRALHVVRGRRTVAERIDQYGPAARNSLNPYFERLDVTYPPEGLIFVGLKQERLLEIWLPDPPRLLKSYPILGASGNIGPKLRQGDLQVPEGLYRIESLNPNSMFHLSLRVNYPNDFDRTKARLENRSNLGGDIMIHGKTGSIGCLAMGDEAIEEIFVLAAETGIENISVILSPVDFRQTHLPAELPDHPEWIHELYDLIKGELLKLK